MWLRIFFYCRLCAYWLLANDNAGAVLRASAIFDCGQQADFAQISLSSEVAVTHYDRNKAPKTPLTCRHEWAQTLLGTKCKIVIFLGRAEPPPVESEPSLILTPAVKRLSKESLDSFNSSWEPNEPQIFETFLFRWHL